MEISATTCSGHPLFAKSGVATEAKAKEMAVKWLVKAHAKMTRTLGL